MTISNWLSTLNRRDSRLFPSFSRLSKVFLLLIVSVCLVSFSARIFASASLKDKQDAAKEGGNQEAWLDESMSSNVVSSIKLISGPIPDNVLAGEVKTFVPLGAIGSINNLVASTFTPAASGIEYVAQMKDDFLGKPAYAQGIGVGFHGLQPILPLWRGFRNVIYIISSLIFAVIGIMIMLRIKISPQVTVGIQNAIPQLITTLILITFSYAIAGLVIDFTYFIQGLVLAVLFSSQGRALTDSLINTSLLNQLQNFGTVSFTFNDLMVNNGFNQTWGLIVQVIPLLPIVTMSAIVGGAIGAIAGLASAGAASLPLAAAGAIGVTAIVLLVLEIIIVVNLIKLLFGLIRVYITVIIKIIFAPIEIGMGAFPNSKIGFSSWIYDLFANLSVFPSIVLFLVILNLIVNNISAGLWTPAILGSAGDFVTSSMLGAMVGIGGLMLVAKLPEMIPQFIFSIKPSPWGTAIGESLTEHRGFPGQVFNRAQKFGEGAYNVSNFGKNVKNGGIGHAARMQLDEQYRKTNSSPDKSRSPPPKPSSGVGDTNEL